MKIAIAFDFLRVRVGEIAETEKFIPTMQSLFKMAEEESKAKARDSPAVAIQKKRLEEKEKKKVLYAKHMQPNGAAKPKKRKGRRSNEGQQEGKMEAAQAAEVEGVGFSNPGQLEETMDRGEAESRSSIREFLGGEAPTVDRVDQAAP
ncbi:MAG: hypothetical protein Q9174_006998 [Haloplaca sp. 1 TL-2023]